MTRFAPYLTVCLACLLLVLPARAQAQGFEVDSDLPALLRTVAGLPFSVQFGAENLFGPRLGLRVGGAVYPVPLLLSRELNAEASADLTYTLRASAGGFLASASAALYAGAGPRYRLTNSAIFLADDLPGSYLGAGAAVGANFNLRAIGFSLVSAFAEAGNDYIWTLGESPNTGRFSPRVRIGLGIPLIGGIGL